MGHIMDRDFSPLIWCHFLFVFLSSSLTIAIPLGRGVKKRLPVRSRNFCLVEGVLYHKGSDGIWRHDIRQEEKEDVLCEAHCERQEGITHETLQLRKKTCINIVKSATSANAWANLRSSHGCHTSQCSCFDPFQKWGLDFVGPFTTATARSRHKYIVVTTDYCTKWVEAKALWDNTATSMTKFLYEHIWCRFGYPIELISDQGSHFLNMVIHDLTHHYAIVHKKSTPYYPQNQRTRHCRIS